MHCPSCFEVGFVPPNCPTCGYQADKRREGVYLPIGTKLHSGEYLVGKVLGKPGGFGITYLAWDTRLDIKVAIKEYLPFQIAARASDGTSVSIHTQDYMPDFEFGLEKFLEEAKTLAQFRHPNIIRVMNFFRENGTAYMVMDYLEGESLAEYLVRVGKLTGPDAVALFLPLLDGLSHMHAKNVLHRDIKPSNIYLTHEGQAILLDFGSARQMLRERSRSLTAVVTPGFAPWEQYHRKGNQGPWTDVYACAATLYFMLTGVVPPDGGERAIGDDMVPIETLVPDIEESISHALSWALLVNIEERTQTADIFQQDLSQNFMKQSSENRNSSALRTNSLIHPSESGSVSAMNTNGFVKGATIFAKYLLVGVIFVLIGTELFIVPKKYTCEEAIVFTGELQQAKNRARNAEREMEQAEQMRKKLLSALGTSVHLPETATPSKINYPDTETTIGWKRIVDLTEQEYCSADPYRSASAIKRADTKEKDLIDGRKQRARKYGISFVVAGSLTITWLKKRPMQK